MKHTIFRHAALLRLGKRLFWLLLSLWLLSVAVFYIASLAPGDPLLAYFGESAEKMTPARRQWAEAYLGLDQPIHIRYLRWLGRALRGDFGMSYQYKQPVTSLIGARMGNTLLLGGLSLLSVCFLALTLGSLCAWRENSLTDRLLCRLGTVTSCIPEFWLSALLILLFSVTLQWLPSSGAYSVGMEGDLPDRLRHLILPLSVSVLSHLWHFAYLIRNKLLQELRQDYVLLAKAKGLPKRQILLRHCLPNTLPTFFSLLGISVPHILGGSFVIEAVFSYPGLGSLAYESARFQDYDLLMLVCLLSGGLVLLSNALARSLSERIDPRTAEQEVPHA